MIFQKQCGCTGMIYHGAMRERVCVWVSERAQGSFREFQTGVRNMKHVDLRHQRPERCIRRGRKSFHVDGGAIKMIVW